MSDLAEFVLARIAEDEAIARDALHPDAVKPGSWSTEYHDSEYHSEPNRAHIAEDRKGHYWSVAHEVFIPNAEHMARHDPARVLVEARAKRELTRRRWFGWPSRTMRLLALPYAEHPDFRPEWGDL